MTSSSCLATNGLVYFAGIKDDAKLNANDVSRIITSIKKIITAASKFGDESVTNILQEWEDHLEAMQALATKVKSMKAHSEYSQVMGG